MQKGRRIQQFGPLATSVTVRRAAQRNPIPPREGRVASSASAEIRPHISNLHPVEARENNVTERAFDIGDARLISGGLLATIAGGPAPNAASALISNTRRLP